MPRSAWASRNPRMRARGVVVGRAPADEDERPVSRQTSRRTRRGHDRSDRVAPSVVVGDDRRSQAPRKVEIDRPHARGRAERADAVGIRRAGRDQALHLVGRSSCAASTSRSGSRCVQVITGKKPVRPRARTRTVPRWRRSSGCRISARSSRRCSTARAAAGLPGCSTSSPRSSAIRMIRSGERLADPALLPRPVQNGADGAGDVPATLASRRSLFALRNRRLEHAM